VSLPVEFHTELVHQLHSWLRDRALFARCEYRLPHGRIADIIAIENNGELSIFEVKTTVKDSLLASAYEKYSPYCHRLYIAAPDLQPHHTIDHNPYTIFPPKDRQTGWILLSDNSTALIKAASYHHIPARRAYALREAILSDQTLANLNSPLTP